MPIIVMGIAVKKHVRGRGILPLIVGVTDKITNRSRVLNAAVEIQVNILYRNDLSGQIGPPGSHFLGIGHKAFMGDDQVIRLIGCRQQVRVPFNRFQRGHVFNRRGRERSNPNLTGVVSGRQIKD